MSKKTRPTAELITIVKKGSEKKYPKSLWEKNQTHLRKDGWSIKETALMGEIKVEQAEIISPSKTIEDGTSLPD